MRSHAVCLCVCESPPLSKFWKAGPIFMKLGMYITARESISTAYFINLSPQSLCLYVYLFIVATQRLGKYVTAATNRHATMKQSLAASFSMRSVSYQRKVDD
jgi:hypothetical protein